MNKRPPFFISFPAAVVSYTILAAWLFYPYSEKLTGNQILWPVQTVIAACGVFFLCRRWVLSFIASLTGGAVYGFGTFACSFFCYHTFAGLVYAFLPWTFLPAVFFYRLANLDSKNTNILSGILALLPILFILASFEFVAVQYSFWPIPVNTSFAPGSLLGIIDPIGIKPGIFAPGFFHVSIAGLLMGIAVVIKTRRKGIIALFILTSAAIFYNPILSVPPVFWASIPVMICALIIASGLETIILAGSSDGKWLLIAAGLLLLLSVADVFFAQQTGIFPISAALYGIGIVAVMFIYFIAEANLTWHLLRMLVLYSAVFIDILISAKHCIDLIF